MATPATASVKMQPPATSAFAWWGLAASGFSGGVAGCVSKTATAPLARLTVLAQTSSLLKPGAPPSYDKVWRGIQLIVSTEGASALWRGNLYTCVHRFPLTGVNFVVVEAFRRCYPECQSGWGRLAPGALAGAAAVGACYPLETMRTRLMAEDLRACGGGCAWRQQWRRGGMYRGMWFSMAITIPASSVCFATYALLRDLTEARGVPSGSLVGTFIAGGFSGVAGSVVVFPLDVLRRRLQVMHESNTPVRSWLGEACHIYQNEKLRGFWRGIKPEVAKVFPTVALKFLTYEQLQALFRSRGQ